jgi:hypothetical protein
VAEYVLLWRHEAAVAAGWDRAIVDYIGTVEADDSEAAAESVSRLHGEVLVFDLADGEHFVLSRKVEWA